MCNILFDLDGTLTDPGEGITNSVAYALKHYGITVPERKSLYKFIGPPLYESFERYYGFTHEKALEAVEVYREYFRDTGIFENRVYAGIPEALETLKESGFNLVIATSKPTVFTERILDKFSLAKYFSFVSGSELDGRRTDKAEVIAYALDNTRGEAVMIGDREHDIIGAKRNNIPSVGVLYGYGSESELKNAGADYIAKNPAEIVKIVLDKREKLYYNNL